MERRMRMGVFASAMAVLLLITGCTGNASSDSPNGSDAGGDDVFKYAYALDVISTGWDPAVAYSNEVVVLQNVYETLTRYNSKTEEVEPLLAEKWETNEDRTEWTFTLRSDATFHTGNPVTSESVKASIEYTIEQQGGAAYIWDVVQEIQILDEHNVVFKLSRPAPLDYISSSAFSAFIFDTEAAEGADLHEWFEQGNDAGSGPYAVAEYNKGQETEVVLSRFEDYWGGWKDGQFSRVEYRVTPEMNTAWQLLQQGQVDYVQWLNAQLFMEAEKTEGISAVKTETFQNVLPLLNTASGPLSDLKVRQAVTMSLDVDAIASSLQGAGSPASGFIPEGLVGFTPDLGLEPDIEEAKRLLAEAGHEDGVTLRMTYAEGDALHQTIATLMASQLAEAGITLDLQPMTWNAQVDQARSSDVAGRQDIFMFNWYPDFPDPYSWFNSLFHSSEEPFYNFAYLDDPKLDAQIEELEIELGAGTEKAGQDIIELQDSIIYEYGAVAPIVVKTQLRAIRSDISGFVDNPLYADVPFVYDLVRKD